MLLDQAGMMTAIEILITLYWTSTVISLRDYFLHTAAPTKNRHNIDKLLPMALMRIAWANN